MDVEDFHRPAEAGMMWVPGELKSPTIVDDGILRKNTNQLLTVIMTLCNTEQRTGNAQPPSGARLASGFIDNSCYHRSCKQMIVYESHPELTRP